MSVSYFSPQQIESLKKEATALKKREGIQQFEALDHIAAREGFGTWRELVVASTRASREDSSPQPAVRCRVIRLADGELPIFEKVEGSTALCLGEEGEDLLAVSKPKKVIFPLFEVKAEADPEDPARPGVFDDMKLLCIHQVKMAIVERIGALRDAVRTNAPECNQMILAIRTPLTRMPGGAREEWFTLIGLGALQVKKPEGTGHFVIEKAGDFVLDPQTRARELLALG